MNKNELEKDAKKLADFLTNGFLRKNKIKKLQNNIKKIEK